MPLRAVNSEDVMIHQFILASPKPGMTEEAFQDYWVNNHAVNYASKIPQIKKYIVDTRIKQENETGEPLFSGIAEIWIKPEEQIASLQTKEFLQGARLDEPNWAAFWKSLVVDTTEDYVFGDEEITETGYVKLVRLLKRKEGLKLGTYRSDLQKVYAPMNTYFDEIKRYMLCHAVDGAYAVGEARFDSVEVFSFLNTDDLNTFIESSEYVFDIMPCLAGLVETGYLFSMTVQENWIIKGRD